MRTIGLLGGMSWESSAEYYRFVNEAVRDRLGGFHSARCLMHSVDFAEIEELQASGDWDAAGEMLAAARAHSRPAAPRCWSSAPTPCTGCAARSRRRSRSRSSTSPTPRPPAVKAAGIETIGLLGTRYTMEGEFYVSRLEQHHGLGCWSPTSPTAASSTTSSTRSSSSGGQRESRERYRRVIARLVDRGAQGVILGCTEIGLLVGPGDSPVPVFDTTRLHAEAAVERAIES